jgi:dextranase
MEIRFQRAFYRPGEPVTVQVFLPQKDLEAAAAESGALLLRTRVSHLARVVLELEHETTAEELVGGVRLSLTLPAIAPRGYGLDLTMSDNQGRVLGRGSAGFDVLNQWTEMPRYGFLTDFAPGRDDAHETMRQLARYHINALQFYDWMYRHDTLLPPQDVYDDPLGRELSLSTVRALIDAAHAYNMAAMPYAAVYAASPAFAGQHPHWALYDAHGAMRLFADGFLVYMDPRPESGWTQHLLAEFERVLREMAFDGIHLDQYGEPRCPICNAWCSTPRRWARASRLYWQLTSIRHGSITCA